MSGDPKPLTAFQQSYHWRNKNCGPYARQWVKDKLPGTKVSDGALSVEVSSVTGVEGDCDLGQRKGKLLTIYDLEVDAKWKGSTTDGTEVTGSLKIPEFSHETIDGISDYVFNITTDATGPDAEALLAFARKALPAELTKILNTFRLDLLTAHGIFEGTTPSASGASTPASLASRTYSPAPPGEVRAPATSRPATSGTSTPVVTGTVTVEASADLQASADDLWTLLTDENRVPMWSRSAAKIKPVAGEEYSLFGGNVTGKVVSVDAPKKIVQTWNTKSPGWPSNHFGTMTITLVQGSDSTNVAFSLDGVPSGKQADIERALDGFYIRGLKSMGLGSIL